MKHAILMVMAVLVATYFVVPGMAADVYSLRGDAALVNTNTEAPREGRLMTHQGGFVRNFEQQPPLIPHTMEKYEINLKVNGCMKCHSRENYEKEKAPQVGDSHYLDADGKKRETISMRRYFCTQCHVPQSSSDPLVENNFTAK